MNQLKNSSSASADVGVSYLFQSLVELGNYRMDSSYLRDAVTPSASERQQRKNCNDARNGDRYIPNVFFPGGTALVQQLQ